MECLLGAAEAARALELAPSTRCRPKSSKSCRRSRRAQLNSAARPSCATTAGSPAEGAEFNSGRRNEEGRIKMKVASRSMRRHAELERAFGQEAAVPNYSTQRVRRAADMVLGKNVSGEEASAILLALILDPCTLSSASDAFRRGRSACEFPIENAFLPFNSANSTAYCDAGRQLRENVARSTPMRLTPGSDNPANSKPASKESPSSRGLPALPSRSRRGQTANSRRSLQAQRAQGKIIPIVKSGSANSANSRTGDPKYAATYIGHAFDRAALRFSSHGGISLPFRKRRLESPTRNGNPPLVHKNERKSRDN